MKRILFITATAALLFTSCEKNEKSRIINDVEFVIEDVVTRVTTIDNVTTFTTDDVIAITSNGLTEDITNEQYTVKDNGLEGKAVTFKEEEMATFVAHYPASLTYSEGAIEMTVPTVQTAENFHENMFMVAQAEGSAAAPQVALKFKHQLAWVKIALNNIEGTVVTLNNIKPTVTWTADALTASGSVADVTAWKQDGTQVYWALVPAQTIAQGTKLVTIETADKSYEYTLAADLTLTTSKVKAITLSVEAPSNPTVNAEISVDATEDIAWEDEAAGLEGNVNEVVIPAIEVITAEEGNLADLTELITGATGWTTIKTDGWNAVINGEDQGSVSVNTSDGCIDLTNIDGGTWYKIALAYKTDKAVKAGKYVLSINAKSESAGQMRYVIAEYDGTVINQNLYQATATEYPATPYTKQIELTEDYQGLIVAITTSTPSGVKYSIKNVTLIEVKE